MSEHAKIATCFGVNLRSARKQAGLSQEEAASLAALHRTEISLLERGERVPGIYTAIKLAAVLGVSLDDLAKGIAWTPGSGKAGRGGVSRRQPGARRRGG